MVKVVKLNNQTWQVGKQLASGGFGHVYKAQSADGKPAVVKFVPKDPGADREFLFKELADIPNVVPILDKGEWDNYWVIAMPEADKSLRDYMKEKSGPLALDKALQVFIDITKALAAMEKPKIVHRDVKPDNILLLDNQWCLADFGISRYAEATTAPDTRKHAWSPPYTAPERWQGTRADNATDVYALGVVIYELLTGRLPFEGPAFREQHLYDAPQPISDISPKLQSLIEGCLDKSPQARPKPQVLLTQLKVLLAQLTGNAQPSSSAELQMQQANAAAVAKKAKISQQQLIAQDKLEQQRQLREAANRSLTRIAKFFDSKVVENAPMSERSGPQPTWSWKLIEAKLSIEPSQPVELHPDGWSMLFDVVAYSSIVLRTPPQSTYAGRSHSLWYCDAQEPGIFRWFQTSFFMSNPVTEHHSALVPFALEPKRDACLALSNVKHTYQPAWPFVAVDQESEDEFIEQWIQWFAAAAQGQLRHPDRLPEQNPNGSWRREANGHSPSQPHNAELNWQHDPEHHGAPPGWKY